jgi:hypothetical protein
MSVGGGDREALVFLRCLLAREVSLAAIAYRFLMGEARGADYGRTTAPSVTVARPVEEHVASSRSRLSTAA